MLRRPIFFDPASRVQADHAVRRKHLIMGRRSDPVIRRIFGERITKRLGGQRPIARYGVLGALHLAAIVIEPTRRRLSGALPIQSPAMTSGTGAQDGAFEQPLIVNYPVVFGGA